MRNSNEFKSLIQSVMPMYTEPAWKTKSRWAEKENAPKPTIRHACSTDRYSFRENGSIARLNPKPWKNKREHKAHKKQRRVNRELGIQEWHPTLK